MNEMRDRLIEVLLNTEIFMDMMYDQLADALVAAGAILPKYKIGEAVFICNENRAVVPVTVNHIQTDDGRVIYNLSGGYSRQEEYVYPAAEEAQSGIT